MTFSKPLPRGRRRSGRGALGLAVFLLAGSGWAQDTQSKGRVVTISEVTIVGRVQKPIAAVDVSRIQPRLTLAELDQPFANRIEKALYRAPF
ncbi:MAG: hypothetical protein GX607_16455 [Myxococcales bacterium]|jgi:hypothetical protein|nr:hypothetical protein [Myxococcales bacterium]